MDSPTSETPRDTSETKPGRDGAINWSTSSEAEGGYQIDNSQQGGVRIGDRSTVPGLIVGGDVHGNVHIHNNRGFGNDNAFTVPYPQNPLFVGRNEVLESLHAQLAAYRRVVVTGTGGLGKTQLAVEYAHRYREEYPGGIYWLTMQPAESIAGQIAMLAGLGGLNLPGAEIWDSRIRIAAVRAAW